MHSRYSWHATRARREGHFASATTCAHARNDAWVSAALRERPQTLTMGDKALLSEWAPQQWQRDLAAHLMR